MRYHVDTLRRALRGGYYSPRRRRLWHWILWAFFKRFHDGAILEWVGAGMDPDGDKAREALALADQMEAWAAVNGSKVPD